MFGTPSGFSSDVDRHVTRAIVMVVMHFVGAVVHGVAHLHYEIPLEPWQKVYIVVVITMAPLVAGILLWRGRIRMGAWLLLASMGASLLFGLAFHFFLLGPDHVSSVNMEPWGATFQATAFLLAVTEAVGMLAALGVLRADRSSR